MRRDPPAAGLPVRYVCMPGSPYTGSTLLGFLLNEHPAIASIGAATGLTAKVDLATYRCSCGSRFVDCDFWMAIAWSTAELGAPVTVFETGFWNTHVRLSRRRWLNGVLIGPVGGPRTTAIRDRTVGPLPPIRRVVAEARRSSWSLATAVLRATGADVFVDTARDHQRPKHLAGDGRFDLRIIHLVRDPRGNVASIMKHTGVDAATAARRWSHYNLEAERVRRRFPLDAQMLLRYEDLCADPKGALDEIAGFLGVGSSAPLPGGDHHIIGNSMRLGEIVAIREDRTWETTLGSHDLRVIADVTSSLGRRLGYRWSAPDPAQSMR